MSDPLKKRGGKRPGAGRKKKAKSGLTVDGIDLQAAIAAVPPAEIETAASPHARMAINALYKQLIGGASETAKVAAANAILDRGYGRPAVEVGGDALLPFQAAPVTPSVSNEIRRRSPQICDAGDRSATAYRRRWRKRKRACAGGEDLARSRARRGGAGAQPRQTV